MTFSFTGGARVDHVVASVEPDGRVSTYCGVVMANTPRKNPKVCYRCREAVKIGMPQVVVKDNPNPTCTWSGRKVSHPRQVKGDHICPGCGQAVDWEFGVRYTSNYSYASHTRTAMDKPQQVVTELVEDVPAPF